MKITINKLKTVKNKILLVLVSPFSCKKTLTNKKNHEDNYSLENVINAIDRFNNKNSNYITIGIATAVKKPKTIRKANLTLVHSV